MRFLKTSILILVVLYGLVFAVGDAYLSHIGSPLWLMLAFPLVMVALQYALSPRFIEWVMTISWDDAKVLLPQVNREFVERLCAERNIPVPRIGIIYRSGYPNAFSFGRTPRSARVVVTKGLLEVLTPEETNAVLAHEIGHIEHWDVAVMTFAAFVPLALYQLYAFTRTGNKSRAIAFTAYLCYLFSQYLVLLLNRTREYFADHYSAEVTGMPNVLSSALMKIAYGLIYAEGECQKALEQGTPVQKQQWNRERRLGGAVAIMGISSMHAVGALGLSGVEPSAAAGVMQWDLVNPWSRIYELNSTHPLTALRIRALNAEAEAHHQVPGFPLPADAQVRWTGFPLEFVLWASPWILGLVFLANLMVPKWISFPALDPALLIAFGVTWILRNIFRYNGAFQNATIGELIRDLEVSEMKPRAVRLRGKILGRGLPGAFWSPDLVLQDASGILFVLYRQSVPFARLLFAITVASGYTNKEVTIDGWYRRGLKPYIEMSAITTEDGVTRRAWSRYIQLALAAAAIIAGYLWIR